MSPDRPPEVQGRSGDSQIHKFPRRVIFQAMYLSLNKPNHISPAEGQGLPLSQQQGLQGLPLRGRQGLDLPHSAHRLSL